MTIKNYTVGGKTIKRPKEVQAAAQEHAEAAVAKIVELMNTAEDQKIQLQAAKEILDRAYGRSKQTVDINSKHEETKRVTFDPGTIPLEVRQQMLEAHRSGRTIIDAAIEEIEPLDPQLIEAPREQN